MSSGVFRNLRNSECEINDVQSSVSWLQENSEACRDRIATNGEIVRRQVFTDLFSGPDWAVDPVSACVCISRQ